MLTDDQKIQILLVGGPIVSLIGTWMSLRTYSRLKTKGDAAAKAAQATETQAATDQEKPAP